MQRSLHAVAGATAKIQGHTGPASGCDELQSARRTRSISSSTALQQLGTRATLRRGKGAGLDFRVSDAADRVIDVGCGPGSITVGLGQVAGHVTGVDLDDAEFTDARTYVAEHDIENVTFLEGSVYQLDFPDASFDACTLFSMLETLDEPVAALAEIRRVVRPGGVIGASSIE